MRRNRREVSLLVSMCAYCRWVTVLLAWGAALFKYFTFNVVSIVFAAYDDVTRANGSLAYYLSLLLVLLLFYIIIRFILFFLTFSLCWQVVLVLGNVMPYINIPAIIHRVQIPKPNLLLPGQYPSIVDLLLYIVSIFWEGIRWLKLGNRWYLTEFLGLVGVLLIIHFGAIG